VDDVESLQAIAVDEATGKIAVCGGPDIFVYHPYGIKEEALKVRAQRKRSRACGSGSKLC